MRQDDGGYPDHNVRALALAIARHDTAAAQTALEVLAVDRPSWIEAIAQAKARASREHV